jgi:hypothetical protein
MAWRWREKDEVGEEKLRERREGKILNELVQCVTSGNDE